MDVMYSALWEYKGTEWNYLLYFVLLLFHSTEYCLLHDWWRHLWHILATPLALENLYIIHSATVKLHFIIYIGYYLQIYIICVYYIHI